MVEVGGKKEYTSIQSGLLGGVRVNNPVADDRS